MRFKFVLLIWITTQVLFYSCKEKKIKNKEVYWDMISVRTMGLAYLEENKLEEAEAEFRKLIELVPDEALGYANLGLVYLRMSKYAEAEAELLKAIERSPQDPDIRLILVKVYELSNQKEKAIDELKRNISNEPDHVKSLYTLAELYGMSTDKNSLQNRRTYLTKVTENVPANMLPRLQLAEILVKLQDYDEARMHMEEIHRQIPVFPEDTDKFYNNAIELLQSDHADDALTSIMIFHNFLKLTSLYQSGLQELEGPGGPLIGFPVITFGESYFLSGTGEGTSLLETLRFTDATEAAGLPAPIKTNEFILPATIAVADYDGDGDKDLYLGSYSVSKSTYTPRLFRNNLGKFTDDSENAGINHSGKEYSTVFADYDNDGKPDLYILKEGGNILYRNLGEGKFVNVTEKSMTGKETAGNKALFFDMDHEGDLDLFVANTGENSLYRNNGDGSFLDQSEKLTATHNEARSIDAGFGDFDDDGDIDFFVINADAENILYTNLREGIFKDITSECGLSDKGESGAVAIGDYNNDGYLDLFITSLDGSPYLLYRNKRDGTFETVNTTQEVFDVLQQMAGHDAAFFDFDNDGFLDLLVVGEPLKKGGKGVFLFHNEEKGIFKDVSELLPQDLLSGHQIAITDYNQDGDLDMFITGLHGGVRLIRNDGGNVNHFIKIQLLGLSTGSGKNNHFGIGAKLEVRAGDLYQMKVVTEPVVHFGLGFRSKADVVRILWTNGVPQNIFTPRSDQDLVEEQILKGSCPFLYTWNGEKYVFVKDMMWRSALGMPQGIMGGTTAYAFPDASEEYIKIPDDMLQLQDDGYSIKVTSELWEAIYVDKLRLVAVDHPAKSNIYVDERFSPPPFPRHRIYIVTERQTPVSVKDGNGSDLLSFISNKDNRYISALKHTKFQGITELHDLILDPGNVAIDNPDNFFLFLNGWIYPSDASINVAISQSATLKVISPFLQVKNENDKWQTVIRNIGFPMGKDKTVVVDLTDKFLTADRRIRIRTNMEIYWDHIFFASTDQDASVLATTLTPTEADLHYRGFSRMYRKGGRYGPHWFDYYQISEGQKWRDLTGNYTRYGDVRELLMERDDMYIILNGGDEISIRFDASKLPELPTGWKRDFLIYSIGWVKDGDMNTAKGNTVGPLPFHGMTKYPYGENESYPTDPIHSTYQKTYNTRTITTDDFQHMLSKQKHGED